MQVSQLLFIRMFQANSHSKSIHHWPHLQKQTRLFHLRNTLEADTTSVENKQIRSAANSTFKTRNTYHPCSNLEEQVEFAVQHKDNNYPVLTTPFKSTNSQIATPLACTNKNKMNFVYMTMKLQEHEHQKTPIAQYLLKTTAKSDFILLQNTENSFWSCKALHTSHNKPSRPVLSS